MNILLKFLFGF